MNFGTIQNTCRNESFSGALLYILAHILVHILKNTQVITTAHEGWKIFFLVARLAMIKPNNCILFQQNVKNTDTQETASTNNIFFKPASWILSRARRQRLWRLTIITIATTTTRPQIDKSPTNFIKMELATLPIGHCRLLPGLGYISVFMTFYFVFIQYGD